MLHEVIRKEKVSSNLCFQKVQMYHLFFLTLFPCYIYLRSLYFLRTNYFLNVISVLKMKNRNIVFSEDNFFSLMFNNLQSLSNVYCKPL